MLEYITVIVIALAMMAKKGRGRRRRSMGRYIKGRVDEDLDMGTLAAKTLVGTTFDETVNERTLVSSIVASWSISGWTPGIDDGPVIFGVAHGDYSDAEIEEVIENTGSWDEGNKISQEISKRLVRTIGSFDTPADANSVVAVNEGRPVKTKLNWILNQGVRLKIWAYNAGTSAFATTNPIVHAAGHANLFPR